MRRAGQLVGLAARALPLPLLLALLTACLPAAGLEPVPDPARDRPSPWPQVLKVLTYNTFFLPEGYFANDAAQRATLMLETGVLWGYDAIIFQELFDDRAREVLLAGLAEAYPFRTPLVGSRHGLFPAGGVLIVSRWPITASDQFTFGATCTGVDCFADKGVSYGRVEKGGRNYHLFGTHANSGDGERFQVAREAQFRLFREFVAAQQIPVTDSVIFGGDFNVDGFDPERLERSLELLGARAVLPDPAGFSWDGRDNALAAGTGRKRQLLDFLLVADGYAPPLLARATILRARSDRYGPADLSDHHPVAGFFVFSADSPWDHVPAAPR